MNYSLTSARAIAALVLVGSLGCAKSSATDATPTLVTAHDALDSHVPVADSALRWEAQGTMLATRFEGLASNADHVVTRLPRVASDAFKLTAGAQRLSVALQGATSSTVATEAGLLHYVDALGAGTRLTQHVTPEGTEDFVRFEQAPVKAELRYNVALDAGVEGLRLVANTLEFLDASGTPRMRVSPPFGFDATGTRFEATLSVEGAAVDTDARAPWGRAVTAPGTRNVVVAVRWDNRIAYPAVIDPAWVATGNPVTTSTTWETFAVRLSSGKVLYRAAGTTTELYDPTSETWATTGAAPYNFSHRERVMAGAGGLAWSIAGLGTSGYPTAAYDEATGVWTSKDAVPVAAQDGQWGYALAHIGGNQFLLVSGNNGSTQLYDLATNAYTAKASATAYGSYNNAGGYALSNGKVLVQIASVNKLSFFDPATNVWSYSAADTGAGDTNCAPTVELSNGKILWYGAGGSNPNWARIYDPATNTFANTAGFATTPSMSHACNGPNNNASFGTKHFVAGGRFLYDEATNTAVTTPAFASGVAYHQAIVRLLDGRAIAVGGANLIGHNNKADVWAPNSQADCDTAPLGSATTPVYNATTSRCVACNGDNGTAATLACPSTTFPSCSASGACVACSATLLANCTGTTPTCNTAAGSCVGANGDFGTTATQACLTSAAPFALATGACGTCADDGTGTNGCANATPVHAGAFCGATSGACSHLCARDAQCGTSWCASNTGTCTTKLANAAAIPTVSGRNAGDPALAGTCTAAVGAAICASGVCSTSTNTCGFAAGEGTCTAANAATVCQTGLCSAAGVCTSAGSCFGDADCTGGWCALSTNKCQPKVANGGAIPIDAPHMSPALNGTCTTAAATLVCAAGVCEVSDNKCGLGNISACTAATATACRAGVCGADSKCGYGDGDGNCTTANAATVCRSASCRTDGKCGVNTTSADAGAPDGGTKTDGGTRAADAGTTDGGTTTPRPDGGTTTPQTDGGFIVVGNDPGEGAVPSSIEGGGCGCDVAGASPLGVWSLAALGAMLMSRRRKANQASR